MAGSDQTPEAIAQACSPGDILAVPLRALWAAQIVSQLCDFTKTMPIINGALYCVVMEIRPERR